MGNATSAGLGSEAPHDERDIRLVGGKNSDARPDDIELAEEAKGSEVINRKSNLESEVSKFPNKSYSDAKRGAKCYISEDIPAKFYNGAKSGASESPRLPAKFYKRLRSFRFSTFFCFLVRSPYGTADGQMNRWTGKTPNAAHRTTA